MGSTQGTKIPCTTWCVQKKKKNCRGSFNFFILSNTAPDYQGCTAITVGNFNQSIQLKTNNIYRCKKISDEYWSPSGKVCLLNTEKAMAPHSSTLAWKIPWTEEPGRLQSMGSQRVGHDWVTSLSLSLSGTGEGNGNPLQCSCLENPRDGGAWWAAVYGVSQSWTRLKRLAAAAEAVFVLFLFS